MIRRCPRLGSVNKSSSSLRDGRSAHCKSSRKITSGCSSAHRACTNRWNTKDQRADASLVKTFSVKEKYNFKYTFDVYNLTNTSSFDVPGNEVSQNAGYNPFPAAGQPVLPSDCTGTGACNSLYSFPSGLGIVTHTIGSPRQIQMSLRFDF